MARSGDLRKGFTRRQLLGAAGTLAGGASLGGCKYGTQMFLVDEPPRADPREPGWADARVARYRRLGRTGFAMSDISFGCADLSDPAVARRALERGVNYFDTSPDYSNADSERALGRAVRGTRRDALFLVSKFCTPRGHLATDASAPRVIEAVEASLRRLDTEYLDLVHIHAVNSPDRLMAEGIHEAFDRLKQAGKVRFLGVSSHTPDLETVMRHAVESGRFDVIMVAYNFRNWPDLGAIFQLANERDVGVVAMKTLKGAFHTRLADFTPTERETFAQAAFKWVLSNERLSGLVVSMSRPEHVDEYLAASGQALTEADVSVLERYDELVAARYCRPGCGACLASCPASLPIDDVLRYKMYAENYGREAEAMRLYSRLGAASPAEACVSCSAPCERACPAGIPIRQELARADGRLRWTA